MSLTLLQGAVRMGDDNNRHLYPLDPGDSPAVLSAEDDHQAAVKDMPAGSPPTTVGGGWVSRASASRLLPSVLQCWGRWGESVMDCSESPTAQVGQLIMLTTG